MGRLPAGFRVRLHDGVRVSSDGRTVIGGMPLHALFVKPDLALLVRSGTFEVTDARTATLAATLLDRDLAAPAPARASDAQRRGRLTVVVPVKDRTDGLERLLTSLPKRVPVVVVDDGSRDEAGIKRVAARHGARVVRSERSAGPAAARNLGLAVVDSEFVAFIDSDIECGPAEGDDGAWLDLVLAHFDDPQVGLVAPRICPRDRGNGWLSRYEAACSSLDLGDRAALVRPRGRVSYVPSACLIARREAVVGGFDPQLQVAEDVDLVWRVAREGWAVRYEPASTVRHDHRTTFSHWFGRRLFYGTGAASLAQRHGPAVAPLVVAPWSTTVLVLLVTGRRVPTAAAGLIVAAVTGRLAYRLRRAPSPVTTSARITAGGMVSTVTSSAAALTRPWWPLTLLGCLVAPRRFGRIAIAAALIDGGFDYAQRRPELDPARWWLARRLDDIAYGAGLWLGCWRARDARALLPDVIALRRPGSRVSQSRRER